MAVTGCCATQLASVPAVTWAQGTAKASSLTVTWPDGSPPTVRLLLVPGVTSKNWELVVVPVTVTSMQLTSLGASVTARISCGDCGSPDVSGDASGDGARQPVRAMPARPHVSTRNRPNQRHAKIEPIGSLPFSDTQNAVTKRRDSGIGVEVPQLNFRDGRFLCLGRRYTVRRSGLAQTFFAQPPRKNGNPRRSPELPSCENRRGNR